MASKPIFVDGLPFPSLRQAAAHFGKHYGNAARRVKAGWTIEEALELVSHRKKIPSRGIKLATKEGNFDSIRDASERFGIDERTIHKRLSMGWTPDQAVGIEPHNRNPRQTKAITCAGKSYPNSWAMAQAYGKKEKLVAKRLRLGWTPEQAVEIEEAPHRFRNRGSAGNSGLWLRVEIVDDKEYPATDLGEYKLYLITNKLDSKQYVGITINPLWQRFNGHKRAAKKGINTKLYNAMRLHGVDNFSIELIRSDAKSFAELQEQEIAEIAARGTLENGYNVSAGGSIGTPTQVTVGSMTFPSRGAAAEYFGIEETVFNIRISRLGWTPEQAAEIDPRGKYSRNKVSAGGVAYSSIKQAAEANGLDYQLVWDRFKSKRWTIEQALGLVPPPVVVHRGTEVTVHDVTYPSLSACAMHYGIKPATLAARVRRGHDVEDALRLILENMA